MKPTEKQKEKRNNEPQGPETERYISIDIDGLQGKRNSKRNKQINNKKQYLTVIYFSHIYRLIIKDLRKINIYIFLVKLLLREIYKNID